MNPVATPTVLPLFLNAASALLMAFVRAAPNGAEPALGLACGGEIEQPPFGPLDLLAGRIVEILTIGVVDDVFAESDQLAPQVQIVNCPAVILRVDDRDRGAGQARQVLRSADLGQRSVLIEKILQGHRVGDLPALDQLADRGEDPAVHRIAEMLGLKELGDPEIGRVVDQDGPEERLLGVGVAGWEANGFGVGLPQRCDP